MIYRLPGCRLGVRELAERLDRSPGVGVALFREDGWAVARREGAELRFAPHPDGWRMAGDASVLDPERYPGGLDRSWRALACPTAGEVVVSASEGWEFADLGGRHHIGGGSHGSLLAGDSIVPMLAVGLENAPLPERPTISHLMPLVLAHFGVAPGTALRPAVAAGA
jgi:hypothetical protein